MEEKTPTKVAVKVTRFYAVSSNAKKLENAHVPLYGKKDNHPMLSISHTASLRTPFYQCKEDSIEESYIVANGGQREGSGLIDSSLSLNKMNAAVDAQMRMFDELQEMKQINQLTRPRYVPPCSLSAQELQQRQQQQQR